MVLVQMLLPLYDNEKRPFAHSEYDRVSDELTEKFGGLTAYQRSPAEGSWKAHNGKIQFDQVIIFEVMAQELDRNWWKDYRHTLEERFQQQKILVRATQVEEI